jgi:hypothetical protein
MNLPRSALPKKRLPPSYDIHKHADSFERSPIEFHHLVTNLVPAQSKYRRAYTNLKPSYLRKPAIASKGRRQKTSRAPQYPGQRDQAMRPLFPASKTVSLCRFGCRGHAVSVCLFVDRHTPAEADLALSGQIVCRSGLMILVDGIEMGQARERDSRGAGHCRSGTAAHSRGRRDLCDELAVRPIEPPNCVSSQASVGARSADTIKAMQRDRKQRLDR